MKYLGGRKNISAQHIAIETYGELRKQHFTELTKQGSSVLISIHETSSISCKNFNSLLRT